MKRGRKPNEEKLKEIVALYLDFAKDESHGATARVARAVKCSPQYIGKVLKSLGVTTPRGQSGVLSPEVPDQSPPAPQWQEPPESLTQAPKTVIELMPEEWPNR